MERPPYEVVGVDDSALIEIWARERNRGATRTTVLGTLRWLHSCAMKRTLEMGEMADTSEATVGSYAPWSMRLVGVALLVVTISIAVVSIRSDRTVGDWASLPFLGVMLTATLILSLIHI